MLWTDVPTGCTARFRGLAPVDRGVAWVSGTEGTVLRTVDGGDTWLDISPGGDTGELQFRYIEAFDERRAVILSIGEGGDSRVYRTGDGGTTWQRTFVNDDPAAFYDCLGFWDSRHGIALSDPVGGAFRILATDAWIASGGGATSREFYSTDRGRTWSVTSTPVASSAAGGIFSLALRGTRDLVAVGGDFTTPTVGTDASAYSTDAGRTWTAGSALGGNRSGAAWLTQKQQGKAPGADAVIAVGPTGTDLSRDGGRTWSAVDASSLDSVECTRDRACWASGEGGRVAVLALGRRR